MDNDGQQSKGNQVVLTDCQWGRTRLLADMQPLVGQLKARGQTSLSAMEVDYCRFYGIDKENQIENIVHRLGYFNAAGYKLACHVFTHALEQSALAGEDRKAKSAGVDASVYVDSSLASGRSQGTVFLFHGYFDHTGLYRHIIDFLLRAGFDVVIYDLPGHGLSSGESAAIADFSHYRDILEQCLQLCHDMLPKPWFAVGQSTGAAVLMEYVMGGSAQSRGLPFQHWVFLAPLIRPCGWDKLLFLYALFGRFLKTWKRKFKANSYDAKFVSFLQCIDPLQASAISVQWAGALRAWVREIELKSPVYLPVTIIQGPDDETVDWRYNIPRLKQLFPLAQVKLLVRGRHQLVNETEDIRSKVFALMLNGIRSSD